MDECTEIKKERMELRKEVLEIWEEGKEYTTWDIIIKLYFGKEVNFSLEQKIKEKQ